MSTTNEKKFKHLTLEDRIAIQSGLDKSMTFKEIGKYIGKDASTVSKEVRRHMTCKSTDVIRYSEDGSLLETPCKRLLGPPYVCNNCEKRSRRCSFNKQLYLAKQAHDAYLASLSESRRGVFLDRSAFWTMDEIIKDGFDKGQHLYHILTHHDLAYSQSSVYRLAKQGVLSVSAIDFPRVVKFRERKKKSAEYVPPECKKGRTYSDFQAYTAENEISNWVEMDTVIGRIGGKVIVTFDFTTCNFMFGLLADDKSSASVSKVVDDLKKRLSDGKNPFGSVFPLLLTDNGGEFANTSAFENDADGKQETKLFFCDPMKSCQKPKVEKNHTLFRDIVPQGSSFDDFTQETVNLIFSHVNGVARKSLMGKSPYEMFCVYYKPEIAGLLGIKSVDPQDVVQSPKLLENLK